VSLFSELKRRNVFRVAAAYLVTGWLLIEIGNTLEETLNLPDWADTLLAFFLILGFPIALFVSWAYEITLEGIKREQEVDIDASSRSATARRLNQLTVTIMALALAYFALDKWVLTGEHSTLVESPTELAAITAAEGMPPTPEQASATEETASVAVLPFVNMSPDPENEYFSDGISEELLNLLVQVEGLRVPSRTSSFAFKGMNTDIREIASQLEVGHILEGSVRKAGNRVRVTAQLIEVSTDTHLWSDTYDRELEDIFAIQDEIAGHIVEELKLALGNDVASSASTENIEAYNLYLRGLHLFQQRGARVLREAEKLLEEAVALDPGFAKAWGLLALVRVTAPGYLGIDSSTTEAAALDAADRASELDPALLEPLLVQSQVASQRQDFDESIRLLEQAIAAHPRVALVRLWHGIDLLNAGYIAEAVVQLEESVRVDPIASVSLDWLARAYAQDRQFEKSVATAQKAIQLGRAQAALAILASAMATGRFDWLTEEVAQDFAAPFAYFQHIEALTENPGQYDAAMEWAHQNFINGESNPKRLFRYSRLTFSWAAKRPEEAYEYLRDLMTFDSTVISQMWQPDGKWFRNHPQGQKLMREAGLPELWQKKGWPDLCRPLDNDEFECD
jgi:TolB-like protein